MTLINITRIPATGAFAASNNQWTPYSFPTSLILASILLIVGIGLILLGRRLINSVKVPHPSGGLKVLIVVIWIFSLLILLRVYRVRSVRFDGAVQNGPIFPITLAAAVCTFVYLAYISRHDGILAALGNAFVGAAAGPMVFELPFDLIVISQVNAPMIYVIIFFVPLIIAVSTTLSLLLLSRRTSITRYSMYSLGAMFIVFAAWALVGFSYPSKPVPFLLNAVSKVLSFVTIAALFYTGSKHVSRDEIKASLNEPF